MTTEAQYLLAADALLSAHTAIVIFIVVSLPLILLGGRRGWSWVRNPWYRVVHLGAIAYVVLQAWLGTICPLTLWEMRLRALAGDATYAGSFISHWLSALLYYDLPIWAFAVIYTGFGAAVAWAWVHVRPGPF